MNRKNLITLAIVALFTLSACNSNKIVEVVVNKYADGKPQDVVVYEIVRGDSIVIMEKKFHPNGEHYMEGSYKDGKRQGAWTAWYPNGLIWSECIYDAGVENGSYKTFHQNGLPYIEGQYQNGQKVGIWQFTSDTGELLTTHNFDTNETVNHVKNVESQDAE